MIFIYYLPVFQPLYIPLYCIFFIYNLLLFKVFFAKKNFILSSDDKYSGQFLIHPEILGRHIYSDLRIVVLELDSKFFYACKDKFGIRCNCSDLSRNLLKIKKFRRAFKPTTSNDENVRKF